jgi:hypothetical protein
VTSASLKHKGYRPIHVFILIRFSCHTPANSQLFHISLLSNTFQYMFFYTKTRLFLNIMLLRFSLMALLKHFIFYYHYICLSRSLSLLSKNTLIASSTWMLIAYYTVPLSSPQANLSQSYNCVPFVTLFYWIIYGQTNNLISVFYNLSHEQSNVNKSIFSGCCNIRYM